MHIGLFWIGVRIMNRRVEVLKKIISYAKKKKIPTKLIVVMVTIILLAMHLFDGIKKGIVTVFKIIFPDFITVATYVIIGFLFSITFMVYETDEGAELYNNNSEAVKEIQTNVLNISSSGELLIYDNDTLPIEEVKEYTPQELKQMSFFIRVNRLANCVTVYTKDEKGEYTVPVKAMICSTGGEGTPLGVYSTTQKYTFKKLLFDVYGQYATRIYGQILFHSVSYSSNAKDTLISDEFNKLGTPASHGCIRLTTEDAKWIYDYCKAGTGVEIYDDENPGPLGKPEMIKVPEDTVWDPTDTEAAENPWNEKMPVIEAEDIYIKHGVKFDIYNYIKVFDTCGNDVTKDAVIEGFVNTGETGSYEIKLSITDLIERKAEKTINVIVEG